MKNSKKVDLKLIIIISLICFFLIFLIWAFLRINMYESKVFPNSSIQKYDISLIEYKDLRKKVSSISDEILGKSITLKYGSINLKYTFKDLGFVVDEESIIKNIEKSQSSNNIFKKFLQTFGFYKNVYKYNISYNESEMRNFLNDLKKKFDVSLENGKFIVDSSRNVSYQAGRDSFYLDVDASLKVIIDNFKKGINDDTLICLVGSSEHATGSDSYKFINTKVSSFKTDFNPYIVRATNLINGLKNIDGVVVEPGEVFSFYKYAGPYNKSGYVFYYEYVGNGVCQIATTIYNTALLGGLEIVKRYPHAAKSTYVPGGLDATVASYSDGRYVDFQFKNTYKYPIYISAYAYKGEAHVDFWSNSDAMEGKTYRTESVKIGNLGYTTYLYTYKDGVEIDKSKIATTWYTKPF